MATGHLGHQVSARRIVIVIFVTWYPLEFLVDYPLPLSFAIKCSYLQCHLVNLVIVLVPVGLRVRVCLRANVKIEWCVCTLSPSPSCSMEKSFLQNIAIAETSSKCRSQKWTWPPWSYSFCGNVFSVSGQPSWQNFQVCCQSAAKQVSCAVLPQGEGTDCLCHQPTWAIENHPKILDSKMDACAVELVFAIHFNTRA